MSPNASSEHWPPTAACASNSLTVSIPFSASSAASALSTAIRMLISGAVAAPAAPLRQPSYLQPQAQSPASAGPSSLDLMKQCFDGSISGSIQNASCVGYISGYVGAIRMASAAAQDFPVCLPETGIANEAIVSDVSSFLEENPESLQKSARSVVFVVLSKRYPCAAK